MDAVNNVAASTEMMNSVLMNMVTEATEFAEKVVKVDTEMKVESLAYETGIGAVIDMVA